MTLQVTRRGAGPELVLVHGWGLHSGVWGPFADELARHFRLTLVDLPGHGASPPLAGRASLAAMADAVAAVAPPRAAWLGWSLGAMVALAAAAARPAQVAALALVAGTPRFVAGPGWPAAMEPAVLADFARDLAADHGATIGRFLGLVARGAPATAGLLRALRRDLAAGPAPDPAMLALGLAILRDADLRPALAGLEAPALALLGGRDTLVPAAAGSAMKALQPALRVEIVAAAGHAPFLSHTGHCVQTVRDFLL